MPKQYEVLLVNGDLRGPLTAGEVRSLARSGALQPNDQLREVGKTSFRRAESIAGLFPSSLPASKNSDSIHSHDGGEEDWFTSVIQAASLESDKPKEDTLPKPARRKPFSDPILGLVAILGLGVLGFTGVMAILGEHPLFVGTCFLVGSAATIVGIKNEILLIREWNNDRIRTLAEEREWDSYFASKQPGNTKQETIGRLQLPGVPSSLVYSLLVIGLFYFAWQQAGILGFLLCLLPAAVFCTTLWYFRAIQFFEDNILVFICLIALAGFFGAPTLLIGLASFAPMTSLAAFILHILAIGSAIKLCVNGMGPVACTFYYLAWELLIVVCSIPFRLAESSVLVWAMERWSASN